MTQEKQTDPTTIPSAELATCDVSPATVVRQPGRIARFAGNVKYVIRKIRCARENMDFIARALGPYARHNRHMQDQWGEKCGELLVKYFPTPWEQCLLAFPFLWWRCNRGDFEPEN